MNKLREMVKNGWVIRGQVSQNNYYFEAKHDKLGVVRVNDPIIQTCIDKIYGIVTSQKMDIDK